MRPLFELEEKKQRNFTIRRAKHSLFWRKSSSCYWVYMCVCCVCVCVCVCVYVCLYVYIYKCIYVCVYVYLIAYERSKFCTWIILRIWIFAHFIFYHCAWFSLVKLYSLSEQSVKNYILIQCSLKACCVFLKEEKILLS